MAFPGAASGLAQVQEQRLPGLLLLGHGETGFASQRGVKCSKKRTAADAMPRLERVNAVLRQDSILTLALYITRPSWSWNVGS